MQSTSPGRHSVVNQADVSRQSTTGNGKDTSTTHRMKYSRQENIEITGCYYRSEPGRRGYIRMAYIWKERGGFALSEERLATQARTIMNKEWLTEQELVEIKQQESTDNVNREEEEARVALEVIDEAALANIY